MGISITVKITTSRKPKTRLQRKVRQQPPKMDPMEKLADQLQASFYTIAVQRICKEYAQFNTASSHSIQEIPAPDLHPNHRLSKLCRHITTKLQQEQREHDSNDQSPDTTLDLKKHKYHKLVSETAAKLTLQPEDLHTQMRSYADSGRRQSAKTETTAIELADGKHWQGLANRLSYDLAAIDALLRGEESRRSSTASTTSLHSTTYVNTPAEFVMEAGNTAPPVWCTPTGRVASLDLSTLPPSPPKRKPSLIEFVTRRRSDVENKMVYLQRLHYLLEEVKGEYFDDITSYMYRGKYEIFYELRDPAREGNVVGRKAMEWRLVDYEKLEEVREDEDRENVDPKDLAPVQEKVEEKEKPRYIMGPEILPGDWWYFMI